MMRVVILFSYMELRLTDYQDSITFIIDVIILVYFIYLMIFTLYLIPNKYIHH